ncbi:MAG: efflux RND transporter periplasmic adaptor subunit [Treponema sp.]|jgi:multidrug efflux pump subunit AcrA (membrane-fusion protein)|nr:efflux RND transporter periplasmic adaptor subunit [Treponema sp.]
MKKFVIIFAVLLIVAGLIFILPMLRGKNTAAAEQAISAPIFTVRTENAVTRNLQAYIEVNANIISGHQVAVMPDANGRLVSMRVGLGGMVQRGALIAEVDPSRPGTDYSLSPVYAPASGMVVSNPQTVGSVVSTSTPLFTLAVNNSIEIEALIPEREIGQLRTGLTAEIRLEAFPGETFAAALTLVSPVVDPVSRTRKITLQFNRTDQRIIPGMFSRVKLNTRNYVNVVSVPQEAIVEYRGTTLVYVLDTNPQDIYSDGIPPGTPRVQAREINIGVTVDREVEIKTGLEPGEAVVVQGQQFLTDGAPVRVIGSKL